MERSDAQVSGRLEDDLRTMILSNVQIGGPTHGRNDQPRGNVQNHPHVGPDSQRGRPQHQYRPHWQHRQQHQPRPQPGQPGQPNPPTNAPYVSPPVQTHQAAGPHPGPAPKILQRPHHPTGPANRAPGPMNRPPYPRHNGFAPRQQLSQPKGPWNMAVENKMAQVQFLDSIAMEQLPRVEITAAEIDQKEDFRRLLEAILKDAIARERPENLETIELIGFGSLASGFATPGSDMDLAIVPVWKDLSIGSTDREIPESVARMLEKAILDCKMGGRLLTRTRVPILKICRHPSEELFTALCEERQKWESLPEEEKYLQHSRRSKTEANADPQLDDKLEAATDNNGKKGTEATEQSAAGLVQGMPQPNHDELPADHINGQGPATKTADVSQDKDTATPQDAASNAQPQRPRERQWLREKMLGPLDFPKTGVGIQCDINFSNMLGIHNTHLLRCYSLCDSRVRPMILFVKAWAKQRQINSSYSGTLSSYGWVLMVLHFLVNIAQPPVCPNLQVTLRPPGDLNVERLEQMFHVPKVAGYTVRFWRNEGEIIHSAQSGQLTRNRESIGSLLKEFFQYYAAIQPLGPGRARNFYWTQEVLSLRTPGGIITKQEKQWQSAKTTITADGKEVRHRYLLAIEDPFELDHNVARTVTHNGIVAIRDEFRRVWRIINAVGQGRQPEGGIFDEVIMKPAPSPAPKQETPPADKHDTEREERLSQMVRDLTLSVESPSVPAQVGAVDK